MNFNSLYITQPAPTSQEGKLVHYLFVGRPKTEDRRHNTKLGIATDFQLPTSNFKLLTLIILLTIFSCKKATSSQFDAIIKSKQGIFRGTEIGNTIEEVKALENTTFLVDNMPEYLYYDYKLDKGNSYTISYDFSQNSLYEIELSAYFDKIDDANNLFTELTTHFFKRYGKGKIATDGYTSWQTKSKKTGNTIEIAMINDSQEYGYISILISDLNY